MLGVPAALIAATAVAAGPATRHSTTARASTRPSTGPTTLTIRPLDPFPPLPGARKPKFTAELSEVCRLARLGLPDRAYLTGLWSAHAAEWQADPAADDPTIQVLLGICRSEGIGGPADQGEAVGHFDAGVRQGSTAAMVRLGVAYTAGAGVAPDPTTAVVLYRRAADAGDADGMACLARAYESGVGVTQDFAEAVRFYRAASDAGCPVGDLGLARAYRLGLGVKPAAAAAQGYMRRALQAGSALAMIDLGDGSARGFRGFIQDLPTAATWYLRAAKLGSPDAMLRLADLCLSQPSVPTAPDGATTQPSTKPTTAELPDVGAAVAWVKRAAATGEPAALERLADLYASGMPPVVVADPSMALAYYHKSADAGGTAALARLGTAYRDGWHVERDVARARDLFSQGAEAGDADCMAALAATYDESFRGLDHDKPTEAYWYERAAAAGNAAGMLGLASCYLNGTGLDRDLTMAARWYGKAADAGSAAALNGLGMVYNRPGNDGIGSRRNPAQAVAWFRQAASLGDTDGMRNLAAAYATGNGVPADLNRAIKILQVAIQTLQGRADPRRTADAMLDLARIYASGQQGPLDGRAAIDWANRAAASGNPAAWTLLGNVYAKGWGVAKDPVAALSDYRKGATGGDVPAMLAAGAMRQAGEAGPFDEREAYGWYSKAATAGSTEGMVRLGLLYWKGTQAAHNLPIAASWFQRAADGGDAMGAGYLSEMRLKGLGGPQDLQAATKLAAQAGVGGHPERLTAVGEAYLQSTASQKPDRVKADVLLDFAARLGDARAATILRQERATPPATMPNGPVGADATSGRPVAR
jgi:TPR repeat protein